MRYSIFALLGALALFGCNTTGTGGGDDGDDEGNGKGGNGEQTKAPEFPEGTGQAPQVAKAYPPGPYGLFKGTVIRNMKFIGFPNAMKDATAMKEVQLADFYNPTGDAVYEEGTIFEPGTPKPTALLINAGSVWCPPCNEEAKVTLPKAYDKYKPIGGEILSVLIDGTTPGIAATPKSLFNWSQKYDTVYALVLDPASQIMELSSSEAFPTNFIIDTRTMTIIDVIAGAPQIGDSFFAKYEKVIKGF